MKRFLLLIALLALAAPASPRTAIPPPSAWASACEDFDEWDKPGPPFRIHGNSYYVGTCGIAAILIAGNRGHVLIDSGTEAGAAIVGGNIVKLGFRLTDVKLLLHSHEHFDHVGGMARLQRMTGATLVASAEAAPVLASGRDGAGDPQAGMHAAFAAASVGRVLGANSEVALGNIRLSAIPTPGHTPGALSWQWRSCEQGPRRQCRWLVYADSLNPISGPAYRFSDHPAYVAAFRRGIDRLASLDCEVLLTPHPGGSAMRRRLLSPEGLADPGACLAYSEAIRQRLDARLASEMAGKTP